MKINGPNPLLPNSAIRRTGRTDRRPGTEFAGHLPGSEDAGTAKSVGVGANTAIESLLSLQEVAEDPRRRKRAMKRGMDLLDRLDDIRIALLSGRMPQEQLQRLAEVLKTRKEPVGDPRLAQILDEIEIRAAVELAKLEQIQ
jgi:hypothetical protein